MCPQCDQHRRDYDARVVARIVEANKQAKRNRREWLRRAAAACLKGNTTLAFNLIERANQELPA